MRDNYKSSDFFVGKIAPFLLFEIEFHSLFHVVERLKDDRSYTELNPAAQSAFITLFSYFEAYCKHQFAAIVNLFPSLVQPFATRRGEPKVEISTIASFAGNIENSLGFILAETYDFGTAKAINGLYRDLLGISPFSADEEREFNRISLNRNLLVHHGGFYTFQYARSIQNLPIGSFNRAFFDSVRIDTEEFGILSDFLFEMAMKITRQSVKAVMALPNWTSVEEDPERKNAVQELLRGIHGYLDD
ncbi:hypothetical protein [Dyadobacter sp. OTU695]|uniref:hypothetical protein n=1 Tax=Dyadobacter sp. OTU695 TaxID=3043860 RepID=UPI00313F04D1